MPAAPTRAFGPMLEAMRRGFANGGYVGGLQSIAMPRLRLAGGGMVRGGGGMVVTLHPDAMNMTMREWFEQEMIRQYGMR